MINKGDGMKMYILLQKITFLILVLVLFGMPHELLYAMQDSEKISSIDVQKMSLTDLQEIFYKTKIDKEISLQIHAETLEESLLKVARATGLKLTYRGDIMVDKEVTLVNEEISVSDALSYVLEGTGLDYKFSRDGYLLISHIDEVVEGELYQETVTGNVTDANTGESLPGVNIIVEGTTTGTSTDVNGNFELQVTDLQQTLIVSYIGYQQQSIPINGRSEINTEMQLDVQMLDEAVVTGYSVQARGDITGSISIVDMDDMRTNPSGSAELALQGQVSGVNVITSGSPGARSNIFIRGISNFGNTHPLVLVDGVEGDLNDIHPNDIESMQVLKDAGAAAIYGVRGSNGVIIVTTKKGQKNSAPTVTYESSVGVELPLSGDPYNIMKPEDQMKIMTQVNPDDRIYGNGVPDYLWVGPPGGGAAFEGDPEVDPSLYHFDPVNAANSYMIAKVNKEGTNWFQEIFDPAKVTNHNLQLSGGSETATYFLGLGLLDQEGTLLNTHLKRYSVRVNTDFDISDHVRIGQNLNLYHKDNPLGSNYSGVFRIPRIIPVYDIGGNFAGPRFGGSIAAVGSPYARRARAATDSDKSWHGIGNVYAELDFLNNFSARTSIGGNLGTTHQHSFDYTGYEQGEGFTSPNGFSESSSYDFEYIWTNLLEYTNTVGVYHDITVMAGTEAVGNSGRSLWGSRNEYFSSDVNYTTLSTGTSRVENASSAYESTLFSLFGDLKYSFDNRYLLGVTLRRDGSSKFGEDNRYGIFPSVSLGWRISNESFMSGIEWLDDLRLKGSYGILGSQNNVSSVNQFDLYGGGFSNAYYPIGGGPGIAQGFIQQRIGNPRTGWEENRILNVGIDLFIFTRLNLTVEYYEKSIDGLLFPQSLPGVIGGAQVPTVNIGDIQNKGVDISTKYTGQLGDELGFSVGANITTYRNLVVDVPDPGYFDTGNTQNISRVVRNQVGHPVSSFFGYDVIGLFQSDQDVADSPTQLGAEPGYFKFRDIDGDGKITSDDRTFLGDPNPDFTYGINVRVNYKNFDLASNLFGSQGADIVSNVRSYLDFLSTYPGANSNRLLNAWTPENTDTNIPKLSRASSFSYDSNMSSYFVDDGSYLKMRSLIVGYTLPTSFLAQFGIERFRVYTQATNLFTITGYSGLDPEVGGSSASFGIETGTYPSNQKSFRFGINLSF